MNKATATRATQPTRPPAIAQPQLLTNAVRETTRAAGQALDPETQRHMSAQLGYDFSQVRIHADERAAALNATLGARGLTVGNHVIFGKNAYAPNSHEGRQLLAHELTHVVQQNQAGTTIAQFSQLQVSASNDPAEHEARDLASKVARGEKVHVQQRAEISLQGAWEQRAAPDGTNQVLNGATTGAVVGGVIGGVVAGGAGAITGAVIGGAVGALVGLAASLFPSYNEIAADADVIAKTDAAWASTEAAATATTRREEGFWIRYNVATRKFEFTATVLGPSIGPAATGSVNLGARPADTTPNTATAVYSVASFHTHTPTAHRTVGRPVSPSSADNAADTADDVVGVVYDYVESPAGSGTIPAGHPIGSAAQRYHSGPNRRQRL